MKEVPELRIKFVELTRCRRCLRRWDATNRGCFCLTLSIRRLFTSVEHRRAALAGGERIVLGCGSGVALTIVIATIATLSAPRGTVL